MVRPLFKFDLSEDILWFYRKMKFLSIFIYIIRVGCSRVKGTERSVYKALCLNIG